MHSTPEVNIVSGSIPNVNNSIVIFLVLFPFYSTDIKTANVLFNHCCTCQEKVFTELFMTTPRYFPPVVIVHYIRQPGAWLDSFPRCSTLYLSTINKGVNEVICQPAPFYSLSSFAFSNLDSRIEEVVSPTILSPTLIILCRSQLLKYAQLHSL